jgi:hypothetical protein
MTKVLTFALLLLATSGAVCAQSEILVAPAGDAGNAAVDFAPTSAASGSAGPARAAASSELPSPGPLYFDHGSNTASSAGSMPSTSGSAPPALPGRPSPKFDYDSREDRWQFGLGFPVVRFRSSAYSATAVGVHVSLAYFVNNWLAVEGAVTSAFGGSVLANEKFKYVGYGGGPKVTLGGDRLEPWVHLLIGGTHILPQTALRSPNGFEIQAGGGADYRLQPGLALRFEGDWINSHVFTQSQNSFQAIVGVVFRF